MKTANGRENCTACIFVKHSHTYVNETVFPSMEKKHAYPSPTSSVVGKCLNESMKTKNQKVRLKKFPLKLLGFEPTSLRMAYGPPRPAVRMTPTLTGP